MNIDKLITFCMLKGNIELHKQFDDHPKFWMMRVRFPDKLFTFDYYKDPDTDGLTFCSGRVSTNEGKLGTQSSEIHGFAHLMKLL